MLVRTMRGKLIDMEALIQEHGHRAALGNAQMNARGDRINSKGEIVATQQQLTTDYNNSNPNAVKSVSVRNITSEILSTAISPAQAIGVAPLDPPKKVRKLSD